MNNGKKNPFAAKKSTTIQRSPDEVYPQRKGLNKPQYLGNSPLDQLFARLERLLSQNLQDITLESLHTSLLPGNPIREHNAAIYDVAKQLLDLLAEVQACALAAKQKMSDQNLVIISLHDIKTFGKLVNLVVIFAIYPALSSLHIGVPLEQRRLADFGTSVYKPLKGPVLEPQEGESDAERFAPHERLLQMAFSQLWPLFEKDSDVRDLLMKGTGYSDFLTVSLSLASVPWWKEKDANEAKVDVTASIASTYDLYQDYTLLLSTPSPAYFKRTVVARLELLPSKAPKGDGVLTLVEFVLGLRDQEQVSISKFDHVARVLLSKPKTVTTVEYFTSIGNQCYDILVNVNRPTVGSCIGHFLEQLWRRNEKVTVDFFLKPIWDVFDPQPTDKLVWSSETAVNNNINVLYTLAQRSLPADLAAAIFLPVLIPLWRYFVFLRQNERPTEVAKSIFIGFLAAMDTNRRLEALDLVAQNVVCEGRWRYRIGPNQLVEICSSPEKLEGAVHLTSSGTGSSSQARAAQFLKNVDAGCSALSALLRPLEAPDVSALFARLLARWLHGTRDAAFERLAEMRLVETVGRDFRDQLAETPGDLLRVVRSVLGAHEDDVTKSEGSIKTEDTDRNQVKAVDTMTLKDVKIEDENGFLDTEKATDGDSDDDSDDEEDDDDDGIALVLELLSAILSQTSELDAAAQKHLEAIRSNLASRTSSTARDLVQRIDAMRLPPASELASQRQMLVRAVKRLEDPMPPIRAQSLYLIRQLVESGSDAIKVDYAVRLHLLQLKDPEPFVYLNVIKGLQSLLERDDSALPLLISVYTGADGADLDERLRVGEVLLRYVEGAGEAFAGERARIICSGAIRLAGRREETDAALRLSAMSVLGACCHTNPLGMIDFLPSAVDCAVGILDFETSREESPMRRAAVVLIHDLVNGTSNSASVPFPAQYREKVLAVLHYVESHDTDLLVREQATSVLGYIDDLVKAALSVEEK
ncbi:putative RNA polymerase II assembly factor [Clavispora lusitaniae]|uniref:RNA polymerase II assembly factor n=1 Tax=Clavispora lusitaniae TaxID=36911 RepID=A0AA91PZ07_CLALS|nr:putative RNA polymerase II assembly factor [Clavispora lusitaniae]